MLTDENATPLEFGPFGSLQLPYTRMGAIDSLDLFGIDELILFLFYHANRTRYRRALDIGANLGLHSIVLSRCGIQVTSFEPDPTHFRKCVENLQRNGATSATAVEAAVSNHAGEAEFVRVLGNTTSSHLAGAKPNPYGELERFPVRLVDFSEAIAGVDLVKIDAEGHEPEILLAAPMESWRTCDAVFELGTRENAERVFSELGDSFLRFFSQKIGWAQAHTVDELPHSHRDGSVFLTSRSAMEWSAAGWV